MRRTPGLSRTARRPVNESPYDYPPSLGPAPKYRPPPPRAPSPRGRWRDRGDRRLDEMFERAGREVERVEQPAWRYMDGYAMRERRPSVARKQFRRRSVSRPVVYEEQRHVLYVQPEYRIADGGRRRYPVELRSPERYRTVEVEPANVYRAQPVQYVETSNRQSPRRSHQHQASRNHADRYAKSSIEVIRVSSSNKPNDFSVQIRRSSS